LCSALRLRKAAGNRWWPVCSIHEGKSILVMWRARVGRQSLLLTNKYCFAPLGRQWRLRQRQLLRKPHLRCSEKQSTR
jgi:hypothetical protein